MRFGFWIVMGLICGSIQGASPTFADDIVPETAVGEEPAAPEVGDASTSESGTPGSETSNENGASTITESDEPSITPEVAPESEAEDAEAFSNSGNFFQKFSFGPYVALSVPRPLNFGIDIKWADLLGLGVNYGFFPSVTLDTARVGFHGTDVRLRWFPFLGSLFLGGAYGKQNLKASAEDQIAGQDIVVNLSIDTTYLTPHVGWRWEWLSGFTMGMELGWQLALDSQANLTVSGDDDGLLSENDEYLDMKADLEAAGKAIGETGLPHVMLLYFGFMF